MGGLILLFILCAWGAASFFLAKFIVKPIKNDGIQAGAIIVLAAMIFIVPLADDIIGGFQFRALCAEGTKIVVDANKARGKTVFLEDISDENISNLLIPITKQTWTYKDVNTNERLLSWNYYHAKGGWLSRLIGFPQGSPPYTFNGSCYAKDAFGEQNIFDRLGIKKR